MHFSRMHFSRTISFGLAFSGFAVLGIATPRPAAAQYAHLTLSGPPGGFAGPSGKVDVLYTPANSGFFTAQVRTLIPNGQPGRVIFDFIQPTNTPDNFSLLIFGTDKLGIPIQVGTYTDAQRADFAAPGHAGLDIGFGHAAITGFPGNFSISEVNITPDATQNNGYKINSFAATFAEPSAGLSGAFSYSATGSYSPVPEPSTWSIFGLGGLGLFGLGLFRLIRRNFPTEASRQIGQ